jgi:hypothetical protein
MGLHTGEPAFGTEGYVGIDVVRAARLAASGQGGSVLLSETTRALLGSALPDGVSVHALGERLLKDIDEPERIYELEIEGVEHAETARRRAKAQSATSGRVASTRQTTEHEDQAGRVQATERKFDVESGD